MSTSLSTTPLAIDGVRLGCAQAGIKQSDRDDLLLIELAPGSQCVAAFTRNAFCAAPVVVARDHLNERTARYLLINSGNANAGTGESGHRAALECCHAVAALCGCESCEVLPFSTGVIGQPLPVARITAALPAAREALRSDGWSAAARAIMTTDTLPKIRSTRIEIAGSPVTITGIAKGSGMICPDMATMLAYIATDAAIEPEPLQHLLESAIAPSFNAISVDGDTSTNDACVLIATCQAAAPRIDDSTSEAYRLLHDAITQVCIELARDIVQDGEGATKLVSVTICGAASHAEARQVGYTIAHSPLVKTALFASDPNWGRILAAVGRAGIEQLDIQGVSLFLDDVQIVAHGGLCDSYTEEAGRTVMQRDAFTIRVELGRGNESATILTCDLSYDYVKINAEYRT